MTAGKHEPLAVGQVEPLNGRTLKPAEHETAFGLKAAAHHRPLGRPLGSHMSQLGIKPGGNGSGVGVQGSTSSSFTFT